MLGMRFSEPYMNATASFVVRDHVRAEFSSRDSVKALAGRVANLALHG
jgi:hypothetical protein